MKPINNNVYFGDFNLLYKLYKVIFLTYSYYFDCSSDMPVIIDAGANIGIATLFFKNQYPNSKVICFEPDKINFGYLKKNVEINGLENIQLNNVALHDHEGLLSFYVQNNIKGGDVGASTFEEYRHYYHNKTNISKVIVPCEKLSRYLEWEEEIDLLKIDIEGSESRVIQEISGSFYKIKNMIKEYHYIPSKNPLSSILSILEKNNHHYTISSWPSKKLNTYTLMIQSKRLL